MSKPKLYKGDNYFVMNDCTRCIVTEERNGAYELEFDYPISGQHYDQVELMAFVDTKASPSGSVQRFRINRITKPLNGVVTVYGVHVSYDLSGIPVSPFTASSAALAMAAIKTNSAVTNPFTYWTDKTTTANMNVSVPCSGRSVLGGMSGSVLDVYGGEFEFDNYTVKLHAERGLNRGVSIRYGKNLTSITQDENCASVYTGVYPYWADTEGTMKQLPEKVVNASGTYSFVRILPLDLSSEWQTQPSDEQLRAKANSYMTANNIGVPKVSLKVGFVQLENTEEYKGMALLERVDLCDTVTVQFEKLGVNATAKCIKTTYNAILDRYESIELGDAKANLATTIATTESKAEKAVSDSVLKDTVARATQAITGNLGGYVVMHDSNSDGEPDEILIMDTADIDTATKIWRWNNGGLGYSSTGYAGPYGTAINQNGEIVADFITTGLLSANLIKAGTITNTSKNMAIDVSNGTVSTISTANAAHKTFISGRDIEIKENNNNAVSITVGNDSGGQIRLTRAGTNSGISLYGYDGSAAFEGGISANTAGISGKITCGRFDVLNGSNQVVVSSNYLTTGGGSFNVHGAEGGACLGIQVVDNYPKIWVGHGALNVLFMDFNSSGRIDLKNIGNINIDGKSAKWRYCTIDGKTQNVLVSDDN